MKLEEAMQSGEKFHWVKPWNGAPYPCNYAHPGKAFSSPINLLFLEAGEYLTYQQIRAIPDARIKKGAKQELVFQSIPIFRKDEKQELVLDDHGEPILERFLLKYVREFHISALEGVKSHFIPTDYEHTQTESMEMADLLISTYGEMHGVIIDEIYGTGNAYNQGNRVVLPDRKQFPNAYEFYSTAFHELGHSTRITLKREELEYAQEELVAEITAAILCTSLGLDDKEVVQNNLAYLQYWQEHIKAARPKELYFAVVAAKEASELILESCPVAKKWLEPNFTAVNLSEQEAEQKKTEWEEKRTDGRRRNQTL